MSTVSEKAPLFVSVLLALGGWFATIVTNWDKTPWGDRAEASKAVAAPAKTRLYVNGFLREASNRSDLNAQLRISEVRQDGSVKDLLIKSVLVDTTFTEPVDVDFSSGAGVKILVTHEGYRQYEVTLYKDAVTVPAVLMKR